MTRTTCAVHLNLLTAAKKAANMRQDSDTSPLAARIAEFKSDPEKLRQASEFVDQLIQQAKKEAELKQKDKDRNKFVSINVYYSR